MAASEGSDYDAEAGRESFGKALSRARSRTGLAESFGAWDEGERFFVLYRPIRDPDSAEVVGLIRATMDAERIFTSVSDFRFGETGHACLIDESMGRVVAGRESACASDGRYARFREFERAERQGAEYFLGSVTGPSSFDRGEASLVAFAKPNLSFVLPEHDWVVLVEQSSWKRTLRSRRSAAI